MIKALGIYIHVQELADVHEVELTYSYQLANDPSLQELMPMVKYMRHGAITKCARSIGWGVRVR